MRRNQCRLSFSHLPIISASRLSPFVNWNVDFIHFWLFEQFDCHQSDQINFSSLNTYIRISNEKINAMAARARERVGYHGDLVLIEDVWSESVCVCGGWTLFSPSVCFVSFPSLSLSVLILSLMFNTDCHLHLLCPRQDWAPRLVFFLHVQSRW